MLKKMLALVWLTICLFSISSFAFAENKESASEGMETEYISQSESDFVPADQSDSSDYTRQSDNYYVANELATTDWETSSDKLQTDDDLVPLSLPTSFSGKSGVTPQSLALPDGEGSMQGMGESFSPNLNTGSGTFSVPISLPPGRRGLQPQVGVAYTTGGGDGILGWGWSMGTPFISRQSDKGIPRYDDTDRFMYNGGQELVPIASTRGGGALPSGENWPTHVWQITDNIVYYRARTEGGFMRFFYNRDADGWLVQDKQGNHFFYGASANERIAHPAGKGTYQWSLSRIEDARRATGAGGNDVVYTYMRDGNDGDGNLLAKDIYWNSYRQEYGAVSKYQYNVHFDYDARPDASASYASGFRLEQRFRLARIKVSSFQYEATGSRKLNRVYLFHYAPQSKSFHSRLQSVQMCGRNWDGKHVLSYDTDTCLPPLTFTYNEIHDLSPTPSYEIAGFGRLNSKVKTLVNSPDVSLEDPNVDLLDVNQDGLPDVFLTVPDYNGFGSDHAVIFNDGRDFSAGVSAERVDNPAGWSLNLHNMNVQVMDIDGTGNADLLHMPYGSQYNYYRLVNTCADTGDDCWEWNEKSVVRVNDAIDFTSDARNIRLLDVNNDHFVDVVRTTGTRTETFINLSGDVNHQGEFGHFNKDGEPISGEPVTSCILMHGGPIQFDNPGVQFGDMNGDGVQDIVHMVSGNLVYWPGRGWGQWGDTDEDCAAGEYVDGTDIEMKNSPWFSNPDAEGVLIADVNGDGLSDLVQIRFNAVDVWINKDGGSFAPRHIINDTPFTNSGQYGRVRLADINGSGTVDIVWGDAGGWKYLDLGGDYTQQDTAEVEIDNQGLPAGLLEQVDNGQGAATFMQYASTTGMMVDAEASGHRWRTRIPMPMVVIKKVISRDFMETLNEDIPGLGGRYVQEYVYRDPFYDAHEQEFKGFGYAESWDREQTADQCSAASIERGEAPIVSRNWFHRGVRPECMEAPLLPSGDPDPAWPSSWGPKTEACLSQLHEDNALLGLSGASIKSDAYSPCNGGRVMSATVSEIEVRRLYPSMNYAKGDKRYVYAVIPNQGRRYTYDPDATVGGGGVTDEIGEWIKITDINSGLLQGFASYKFDVAAPVGSYHLSYGRTVTRTEDHGYPSESHYAGFVNLDPGNDLYAHADCDGYSEYFKMEFNPRTWVHQVARSYMLGPGPANGNSGSCADNHCTEAAPCNDMSKRYTDYGELSQSLVTYYDYPGSGTAPSTFVANYRTYNDYGQVLVEKSGCAASSGGGAPGSCKRFTQNVYTSADDDGVDSGYSAFIRKEIAHVPDGAVKTFEFRARWDAGLAQIVYMQSADGSEAAVEYDSLGRYLGALRTNPETGKLCGAGIYSKKVEYHYETAPMPSLTTWINTSAEICASDRHEEIYTFIDSMGRPYASMTRGDSHLDDSKYPWLLSGVSTLNLKGGVVESCEPLPISAPYDDPATLVTAQHSLTGSFGSFLPSGKWNCSRQAFDQWGRPTISTGPDGVTSEARYGVDTAVALDHFDRTDAEHAGTYVSERVDGLGRTVEKISRHKEGASGWLTERKVTARYNAQGLPIVLTQTEDGVSISRRAYYDSMGRMRLNQDLNFGTWEYYYDDIGQLMWTKNPNGKYVDYEYDMAGRLVSEMARGDLGSESRYYYDAMPDEGELWPLGTPPGWTVYPGMRLLLGGLWP